MVPLPDLPGLAHGIVSLDPPTIQCDGCGLLHTATTIGWAVIGSRIIFTHGRDRRLCVACRVRECGCAKCRGRA